MALSMVIRRWCQQISSWRRAAATIRLSAPGIPAVTPVLGAKSGVTAAADAGYSMIFEVDFQPGAGSQP
jgi:hypothetical protein